MLITKIEAREACDWLRAAGFPQYAQLFRDCRFPVDVERAKRDHSFLDRDALDSLCRRLNALNRLKTRLEPRRSKRREDEDDEEDFCAISPSWTFHRPTGRWRRLHSAEEAPPPGGGGSDVSGSSSSEGEGQNTKEAASASASASGSSSSRCSSTHATPSAGASPRQSSGPEAEGRLLEKGRHLLRRIRLREPPSLDPMPPLPLQDRGRHTSSLRFGASSWAGSSSSSQSESSSAASTPSPAARVSGGRSPAGSGEPQDPRNRINGTAHQSLIFQLPRGHKPGTFPTRLTHRRYRGSRGGGSRASSVSDPDANPDPDTDPDPDPLAGLDHRLSVYDNVPDDQQRALEVQDGGAQEAELGRDLEVQDVFSALDSVLERISRLQQLVCSWSESLSEDACRTGSSSSSSSSSSSPCPSTSRHIQCWGKAGPSQRSRAARQQRWCSGRSLENQSVSQFRRLQTLALLRLTALMDKHAPASRRRCSWPVPKPPGKAKPAEAKGRRVFGVPLLLSLQQTGEPLPPSILRALLHLRDECLDQVGLFRKSGVKSRIQVLRQLVESDPDGVSYRGHSAFDVADMVKQYFRELPEPIFTSKLCESFLHVYQYFPKDQRLLAAQAAILLLPDENREALRALLFFLRDVVACVEENQMTPTNVAVCLAPSLFHLNTVKKDAKFPRKGDRGRPDQQDLSENLAAAQGLADMISEAPRLFQLPEFWPGESLGSTDPPEGPSPEGTGGPESRDQEQRRQRLQWSTQLLLMEAKEENRGWRGHPALEDVDLAFKKVDDGCPLWMWRGRVEVEATDAELLHRLLRQPELWQRTLHRASVVQTLSEEAEVFRCLLRGLYQGRDRDQGLGPGARPPQEQLLLRTWQADPSRGPLYLSSVSTEHPEVLPQGVRAHVHSCLYLLESTGAGRTRLTHLCRTDTRGRSWGWHARASGHLLASELLAIRDSFRSAAAPPEDLPGQTANPAPKGGGV